MKNYGPFCSQAARQMEEQQKKKKGKRKGLGGLSPEKKKMLKVGSLTGNCHS